MVCDRGSDRLCQLKTRPVPLRRVGVGEVGVVHRVVHPGAHRGRQVEEGEPPDVGRDRHQAAEGGEDEQGHGGDHLAAAPVGPQRQRDGPEELGDLGDEGHRAERGVGHVERDLEVVPDEVDAVAERPRDQGRGRQEDEWGVAEAVEDADEGRRLALTGARHDIEIRDDVGVPGVCDRLLQQILRDREVEQRIVCHCRGTLSLTWASGRYSWPHSGGRTVATVSGPSGITATRACGPRRPSAAATAPSRSGAGTRNASSISAGSRPAP